MLPMKKAKGTQQPIIRPILRWRPERVSGMPVFREMRPFAAEMPIARFHENEKPYLRLRATVFPTASHNVVIVCEAFH